MPAKLSKPSSNFREYLKNHYGKKEKILTGIIVVLLIFLIFFQMVYKTGTVFYREGEKNSVALAKKYGDIKEPLDFYYFNREDTYFAVKGENSSNEMVYVLIPPNGKEIQVLKEKDGVSYNQALEIGLKESNVKQIDKLGLGEIDNQVVWELTGRNKSNQLVYFYIDFKTGDLVEKIENL